MADLFGHTEAGRAPPSAENRRSYSGHYAKAGRKAEELIISWLRERPWVINLDDLREDRVMRQADVDVSLQIMDGRNPLAEIKSDYHLGVSGNVLFEVLRLNHTAPPEKACVLGWSARSPATWLLMYAPQKHRIYHWRFEDYRRAKQLYVSEVRKKTRFDIVPTDNIKTTVNILIPWKYCEATCTIHELPA